ncbi:MAG: class I SAM-dependent methyltransferase [Acidimicrobiia bacterium]
MSFSVTVREQLLRVGRRLGPGNLARLRSVLGYLEIGDLARDQLASGALVLCRDRFEVFSEALRRVTGRHPMYLEFGVFEGETMQWWCDQLRPAGAQFVGFDSFEGLPEAWRPGFAAGQFGTAGPPVINDDRVSFVSGWFDETLPDFAIPPHDQLIVNVDSDLYSSARTVLDWVAPHLVSGSLLYFDEFADRDHEPRALHETVAATHLELRPIAAGGGGAHLLFEVV